MNITLTNGEVVTVANVTPAANGIIIDIKDADMTAMEGLFTDQNVGTLKLDENGTIFGIYYNQRLGCIIKDEYGVHVHTKSKKILANIDVSKELSDINSRILSVQNMQDIQNAAIMEIGGMVAQNMENKGEGGGE